MAKAPYRQPRSCTWLALTVGALLSANVVGAGPAQALVPGVTRSVILGGVPPPWTPLVVHGDRVGCWGREQFIQGALPRQIVSQEEPLLAGAVRVRLAGERPLAWTHTALSASPRRVQWAARAARRGSVVRARTRIEYDGFWQVDLDLGRGRFQGAALELPLVSRDARYLHFVNETHYQEQNTLALPRRDGVVWSNRFACMAWLGDDHVGLAWCADSDALFRLRRPDHALSIQRSGAITTLRITLIDHPVTLTEPLRWRFGLIATPIRPLPPRWREWRLAPGPSANAQILWWNAWAGSHADPTPRDPAGLKARAREARSHGQYLLPYVALHALSERTPVYRERGWRWRREPLTRMEDEGTPYWLVCPNTAWSTYLPDQLAALFRETGINGLYLDFTFPFRCQAAEHPCGTKVPGDRISPGVTGTARQGEFRVFATRKLLLSIYERVKAVCPRARILLHTSGALMYPYIGFGDMMLDGEQLRQPLAAAHGDYMKVLPLATLRAEYRGQEAGLVPFVIPELATPSGLPDPKLTAAPRPTHELLALTLLHDVGIWPIYCRLDAVETVRAAQQRFGTATARFLPYWEMGGPVEMSDPTLLASGWRRRRELLLVVVNRRRQAAQAWLRPRRRLGCGRLVAASDAVTGKGLSIRDGGLALAVPDRGFRLVRLSFQASPSRR